MSFVCVDPYLKRTHRTLYNSHKPSRLAKDCNFKKVSAAVYRDEAICDAFITGLLSNAIWQRLLEHKTLDLNSMLSQARALRLGTKVSPICL